MTTSNTGARHPAGSQRLAAELIGTATLVMAIVGSGIMAQRLTDDTGLQLLINAVSTVAVLGVMIWWLGPVSGAHFNPVVTLVECARRRISLGWAVGYGGAQVVGALLGAMVANTMYEFAAVMPSHQVRSGVGQWLGEIIATAGLIGIIGILSPTGQERLAPVVVPLWIGGAYFFTSSTSFANPAVTIGRSISDTFAGIAPGSVPGFILAQCVGALIGALSVGLVVARDAPDDENLLASG